MPLLVMRYEEVIRAPDKAARCLNGFVGGKLDEEQMAIVVDAALHRNRARADGG